VAPGGRSRPRHGVVTVAAKSCPTDDISRAGTPVACRCYRDHRHGDTQAGRPAGGLSPTHPSPSHHRSGPMPGPGEVPSDLLQPAGGRFHAAVPNRGRLGRDSDSLAGTHDPGAGSFKFQPESSCRRSLLLVGYLLIVRRSGGRPSPARTILDDDKLAELTVRLSCHGIIR
jgi:hypothetical protein